MKEFDIMRIILADYNKENVYFRLCVKYDFYKVQFDPTSYPFPAYIELFGAVSKNYSSIRHLHYELELQLKRTYFKNECISNRGLKVSRAE